MCIDAKSPKGQEILRGLIRKMDVIVENFAPGTVARLGFDYETVKQINPGVIMCSLSAFGQTGPLADRPGFDYIAQAYAGVTHMIGDPEGAPSFPMLGLGDVSTGVHAAAAIGYALLYRERTGKGQYLDISLIDAYFHCHEINVQIYSGTKGEFQPKRSGSHHYAVCPLGLFKGRETYMFIIALDHQWPALCQAIGRPELAKDSRYDSNARRVQRIPEVVGIIEKWLASTPSDEEALRILEEARLPVAPVLSIEKAVNHPHFRQRRTVRRVTDRAFGELDIPGMPLRFSEFPQELPLEAPFLGEHNNEILCQYLGYAPEEVRELEKQGVLKKEPLP